MDFSATPEELQTHFQSCGTILRITILCDKLTGRPKGFVSFHVFFFLFCFCFVVNYWLNRHAYVEFADAAAVANAIMLNDSLFKGRQLKVNIDSLFLIMKKIWILYPSERLQRNERTCQLGNLDEGKITQINCSLFHITHVIFTIITLSFFRTSTKSGAAAGFSPRGKTQYSRFDSRFV